jgi:hypothetical protein
VILEKFRIANVTAQSVDRLVSGLVHHLEDGRTLGRCRDKKPRSQGVSGEDSSVETSAAGILFDDVSNGSICKPRGSRSMRALTGQATSPHAIDRDRQSGLCFLDVAHIQCNHRSERRASKAKEKHE